MDTLKKIGLRLVTKHYFYTYQGRGIIDDTPKNLKGDGFASAFWWESPMAVRELVKADLLQKHPEYNPWLESFERIR